ncbi:MAG TPA: S53 family peptidase, partial [Candidatus Acidoferrales bacterium]|nr:S53 family peptidase [Candidatus Acidoferrales bacterium]
RMKFPTMPVEPRKAANGTAPDGSGDLFGNDFRNAYVPGTTLTGAGQCVGLVEFDGYFTNDIYNYAKKAGGGRTNIVIERVLLDNYNGKPSTGLNGGEGETELDIEMAMTIAPGLAKIVSYEAGEEGNQNTVLNAMLANSNVLNLSCSWGWAGPSTNTDAIFLSMDAVGQTFFNASGDTGAYTTGSNSVNAVDYPPNLNSPSSNPYITQVGGTTLTMNSAGNAWSSEVVWSYTSGGISSFYSIPSWQTNVNNLIGRGGSTGFRNIPDVAANANNIYELYNDGDTNSIAVDDNQGTSGAAPLWASFMALVNQQSAANGGASAGFINPALYALAAGANYARYFHDITVGNNTWSGSPHLFYATNNYDLCSGLGAMNGTNLIAALASSAPASPAITSSLSAGNLLITWTTQPRVSYQLQYATSLIPADWSNLGPATNATGSVASMVDSLTNAERFYRVLVVP